MFQSKKNAYHSSRTRVTAQNACLSLNYSACMRRTSIKPCSTSPLPSSETWSRAHFNCYLFLRRILDNKPPFCCCWDWAHALNNQYLWYLHYHHNMHWYQHWCCLTCYHTQTLAILCTLFHLWQSWPLCIWLSLCRNGQLFMAAVTEQMGLLPSPLPSLASLLVVLLAACVHARMSAWMRRTLQFHGAWPLLLYEIHCTKQLNSSLNIRWGG